MSHPVRSSWRSAAALIRVVALGTLLCPAAALAQPAELPLGPPAGAYADRVFPVGWSSDGRYLAFVRERSGDGAISPHLHLNVQDLSSDQLVVDEELPSGGSDVAPDLRRVWRQQQRRIQQALRRFGIRSSAVALQPLPYTGQPGGPYTATLTVRRGEYERVRGYTLELQNGQGRAKPLEEPTFEGYMGAHGVRVLGVLAAPSGDRIAVVVEVVASGYEDVQAYEYRFVGARTGDGF